MVPTQDEVRLSEAHDKIVTFRQTLRDSGHSAAGLEGAPARLNRLLDLGAAAVKALQRRRPRAMHGNSMRLQALRELAEIRAAEATAATAGATSLRSVLTARLDGAS